MQIQKKTKNNFYLKKIFKSGHSKGIYIPSSFLNELRLKDSDIFKVYLNNKKIIIEKYGDD